MSPVALFLVTIAGIFMIGTLGEIVFRRTHVPDVLWLLAMGIVLGPVAGVVNREQLGVIAPYFGAFTLVVVLFDGGSRLQLLEISKSAPRSGLLALLSFTVSVVAVGVASMGARAVGWLPYEWTWLHAIMLGAILGGSSSIIVMPAMTLAKVKASVANLVNLESAFTDAFCVVGAAVMIDVIAQGGTPGAGGASPGVMLGRSLALGIAIGLGSGFLWLVFLRLLQVSEHAYPITLSALLLLYVAIDQVGGSAALGILTCAVIVGNANLIGSKLGFGSTLDLSADVRGFNRQVTFIVKSFFFTFMGAMLGPPWGLVALGGVFGLLLLAVRAPAVRLALLGSRLLPGERQLVLVSMPRGMAAGVLATLPLAAGIPATTDLPNVVFAGALVSILIFAVGFPRARRRADLEAAAIAPGEVKAVSDEPPAGVAAVLADSAAPAPAVPPAASQDSVAPPAAPLDSAAPPAAPSDSTAPPAAPSDSAAQPGAPSDSGAQPADTPPLPTADPAASDPPPSVDP